MIFPDDYIKALGEPYYQDDAGLIYCGDCLDYLKKLPDKCIDLVLTDPPYGIGFKYNGDYVDDHDNTSYGNLIRPLARYPLVLSTYPEEMAKFIFPVLGPPVKCVAWCYNSPTPRQHRQICFWGVTPDFDDMKQPPKNPNDKRIKSSGSLNGVRLYDWWDDIQQVKNVSKAHNHPCPVPVELQARIISITSNPNDLILDPFLGSGTTAVAAKQLGRKYIGIEISQKYCEIAVQRLAQEELF